MSHTCTHALSMLAEGSIELFTMTETFCRKQSRNQSGKKKKDGLQIVEKVNRVRDACGQR